MLALCNRVPEQLLAAASATAPAAQRSEGRYCYGHTSQARTKHRIFGKKPYTPHWRCSRYAAEQQQQQPEERRRPIEWEVQQRPRDQPGSRARLLRLQSAMLKYPPLTFKPRTGTERLHVAGNLTDICLHHFWQWAVSDLVENTTRGRLAEFIVAQALGLETSVRDSWAPYDLMTPEGVRIQVKSCAYLQSWAHDKLSAIRFDIRPKRVWDSNTNVYNEAPARHADVYVFHLLHHHNKGTLDPLDLSQWTFYVLPTTMLDAAVPGARSISLRKLLMLVECTN